MICYKDKTWCNNPKCDNSCGRKLTEEEHQKAIKWWGNESYPISMADFHKKKEEEKQDEEE